MTRILSSVVLIGLIASSAARCGPAPAPPTFATYQCLPDHPERSDTQEQIDACGGERPDVRICCGCSDVLVQLAAQVRQLGANERAAERISFCANSDVDVGIALRGADVAKIQAEMKACLEREQELPPELLDALKRAVDRTDFATGAEELALRRECLRNLNRCGFRNCEDDELGTAWIVPCDPSRSYYRIEQTDFRNPHADKGPKKYVFPEATKLSCAAICKQRGGVCSRHDESGELIGEDRCTERIQQKSGAEGHRGGVPVDHDLLLECRGTPRPERKTE